MQALDELFAGFDKQDFFDQEPLKRLESLRQATEFVFKKDEEEKKKKEKEQAEADKSGKTKDKKPKVAGFKAKVKGHVRRLKMAYDICQPAGRLQPQEIASAQFYMAVKSMVTKIGGEGKGVEELNEKVAKMVEEAINCPGMETLLNRRDDEDIYGTDFMNEIDKVKQPRTKFQLLLLAIKRAIKEYAKINPTQAGKFEEMLQATVNEYNTRDYLTFTNDVATETVYAVQEVVETKLQKFANKIKELFGLLKKDKEKFKAMGITFEEKAFYDILVEVRDKYKFEYADDRCVALAKKIKELIDGSSVYANWLENDNIRAQLSFDLAKLIYKEGYPPQWDEEVFEKVMAQIKGFKTIAVR